MTRHWRGAALGATLGTTTALVLAGVAMVPACGSETVSVATLIVPEAGPTPCSPDTGDGGAAPDAEAGAGSCPAHQFCEPAACCQGTACKGMAGTCQSIPTSCDDGYSPVCGCDGVTYFNDCLRRSGSVQAANPGICTLGTFAFFGPCFGDTTEPCSKSNLGKATCASVVPSLAELEFPGLTQYVQDVTLLLCLSANVPLCWVIPTTPPSPDAGTASPFTIATVSGCSDPSTATTNFGSGVCTDAYTALLADAGSVLVEDEKCH